jgi:hypothetical protein
VHWVDKSCAPTAPPGVSILLSEIEHFPGYRAVRVFDKRRHAISRGFTGFDALDLIMKNSIKRDPMIRLRPPQNVRVLVTPEGESNPGIANVKLQPVQVPWVVLEHSVATQFGAAADFEDVQEALRQRLETKTSILEEALERTQRSQQRFWGINE